jgi:hypothetical protein
MWEWVPDDRRRDQVGGFQVVLDGSGDGALLFPAPPPLFQFDPASFKPAPSRWSRFKL